MTIDTQPDAGAPAGLATEWGWFVAVGIGVLVLGVVAATHILASTLATVWLVGALMIVAGLAQIAVGARSRGWGGVILWALAGILYVAAGVLAFANPLLASAVMTLVLAVALVVSGVSRIAFGIRPNEGWGWIAAGGALSLLVGILIGAGWPGTLWILGMALAVDLIGQGAACTSLGLALRPRR